MANHLREFSSLAILVAFATSGCGRVERPTNIPVDSTRIPGVKSTDFWQHCSFDRQSGNTRCKIFNVNGLLFRDDVFVPYVGERPTSDADLKIQPHGGNEWVDLANGTTLIPQSQFERIKRFLDWDRGLAPRP